MDVVRSEVAALGGRVELASERGKGMRLTIYLPQTLAVMQAVLVRWRQQLLALPAAMVEQVMQYRAGPLAELNAAGQIEWRGRRYPLHYLGRLLGYGDGAPEPRRLAPVMLLRSGVISESDYLRTLGKQISGVHASPGRHKQSAAESSFDAWSRYYKQDENSPNALVSYYTKGSLIGLDLTIRSATNQTFSLDDVMRALWELYGRDFYLGAARGLKEKAFVRLVLDCTGVDISEQIARWVYGREDVPLRALLAMHRIDMRWNAMNHLPTLDVRTRKQGDHVVLATVFEHGAAHQGGLSAHDILVAIDGVRIDSVNSSLESVLARHSPGQRVRVHVFRRDELREFSVKLAAPAQTQCELKPMTAPL